MKRLKVLLVLMLCIITTLSLGMPVFAFDANVSDLTQAPCLTTLAQDKFNAPDGTDFLDYTGTGAENSPEGWGAFGWSDGSKWQRYNTNTNTVEDPARGYYGISGNAGGRIIASKYDYELIRNLDSSSYIDFTKNKDYYITFRIPRISNPYKASAQYMRLYSGTNSIINIGTIRNITIANFSVYSSLPGGSSRIGTIEGEPYTFLIYIGARAGEEKDIVKMKAFHENDPGVSFTYSPNSWDSESSDKIEDIIDSIHLRFTNGTGNRYAAKFGNIRIQESAPIINSIDTQNYSNLDPVIGQPNNIIVPQTNVLNHTQTVQSINWYMYNGGQPEQVQTGSTYTIPNDSNLVGKLLRCEVVVVDDITQEVNTYWPVSGYIRDVVDVANYDFVGTTSWSSVSTTDNMLTPDSTMRVYARVMSNATNDKKPQLVVAIYNASGDMKSAHVANPTNLDSVGTQTELPAFTFSAGTFETGDYVKAYVVNSLQDIRPLKTNLNSPVGSYTFPGYPIF